MDRAGFKLTTFTDSLKTFVYIPILEFQLFVPFVNRTTRKKDNDLSRDRGWDNKNYFHNFSFLHIRNKLLLRQKLVWSLDHDREKVLRKTIVEHDNRWKKVKNAIAFDLKENWQTTLKWLHFNHFLILTTLFFPNHSFCYTSTNNGFFFWKILKSHNLLLVIIISS